MSGEYGVWFRRSRPTSREPELPFSENLAALPDRPRPEVLLDLVRHGVQPALPQSLLLVEQQGLDVVRVVQAADARHPATAPQNAAAAFRAVLAPQGAAPRAEAANGPSRKRSGVLGLTELTRRGQSQFRPTLRLPEVGTVPK